MYLPTTTTTLLLTLASTLALALPTTVEDATALAAVEARQSCYVKCGSTCYTSAQVSAARSAGYSYYSSGDTAGSSTYPHQYNNYEGFDFLVSGPYQEFPLRTSGTYTGGMLCEPLCFFFSLPFPSLLSLSLSFFFFFWKKGIGDAGCQDTRFRGVWIMLMRH